MINELKIRSLNNNKLADFCHRGPIHGGFERRKREGMVLEDIDELLSPS